MQQVFAGIALIVVGGLLIFLMQRKPSLFYNWIDMKILRKMIGEKPTIIVLNIVGLVFVVVGLYVILTS